mmetsp:Transcript_22658/g.21827  ORF Transcript_22658/g.21827 Transcript_22658/m.21827 type:complete len:183 (+) Transcript_22658:1774-2322(+)
MVWQYKAELPEKRQQIINSQKNFEQGFEELKNSQYFNKILGYILSIGNILNGGTNKGQADGFYLEALSKASTMRDMNNKSILQLICEKMKQEDENFVEGFKNDFKNAYVCSQLLMKDEEQKVKDMQVAFGKAKASFEIVVKTAPNVDSDVFCQKITELLAKTFKEIEGFEKKLENIKKTYKE